MFMRGLSLSRVENAISICGAAAGNLGQSRWTKGLRNGNQLPCLLHKDVLSGHLEQNPCKL